MQKIRRIILLFSSLFLFNHTAGLHAITYEYVMYGDRAYGSEKNSGTSSSGGSNQGGGYSGPQGGYNGYPEIYQQQLSEKEKQEKAEAEERARQEAERIIAQEEARLAEEKRQAEEKARQEEAAKQEAERKAEEERIAAEQKAQEEAKRKTELQIEITKLITEVQSISVNNNKSSDEKNLSKKINELQHELAVIEGRSSASQSQNTSENLALAETVNSETTGDPVKTTTGAYIQSSNDIKTASFELTRYYESDRTAVSAFGQGWCSNLDERIILGTQPMAAEVYEQMNKNVESLQKQKEDLEQLVCTNLTVTSVDTALEEIEQKVSQAYNILSQAQNFVPELDITADEVLTQAQTKIDQLLNDKNLLDQYFIQLEELKSSIAKSQKEAEAYAEQTYYPDKDRRSRNAYVYYAGDDLNKYETGLSTITLIDSQGYPHLLSEDQNNSSVWKNDDDKSIVECHMQGNGYELVQADGTKKNFDKNGQLIKITDRNDQTILIKRDASGKLIEVTTSYGENFSFTYYAGYIKTICSKRDPDYKTQYSFSGNKLTSYTDTDDNTVQMKYDADGRMTLLTKCDGSKVQFVYGEKSYDGKTLTTQTINEEGFAETFTYDLVNKKTIYTDHDGNKTIYYYDKNHRTVRQEKPDGTVIQNKYDQSGNLTECNQNGVRILYSYDEAGNKTYASYSDGSTEEFQYDRFNLLTFYKNRDGIRYEYIRNNKGNITSYKCGGKTVCDYSYNHKGEITRQILYGQEQIITDYEYDSFGNLISQNSGNLKIKNLYDKRNRIIKHIQNNKVISTYAYEKHKSIRTDYNGLETTIIKNGRNDITQVIQKDLVTGIIHRTQVEYDKRHLPVKIYKGDDKNLVLKAEYSYTPSGLLQSQKILAGADDEKTLITSYEYKNGLIYKTKKYFEGQENQAIIDTYDFANTAAGGFLLTLKNPLGIENLFEFDSGGNIIKHTDGSNKSILCEFSPDGKLLRQQNQYGGWYYNNYDEAGHIAKSGQENALYQNTWNNDGTIKTQTDPLGNTTYFTYDNCGNLICKKENNQTQWFEYDDFNRLTAQITGQTPDKNTCDFYITYEYSEDGRKKTVTKGGLYPIIYEYDAFGNNISQTDGNKNTISFEYDFNNNMFCQSDAYGNKTHYAYNNLKKIKRITLPDSQKFSYEYDCNENLLKVCDSEGELYSAVYDKAGRLIKQNQRGATSESFEYDNSNKITKYYFGDQLVQSFTFSSNNKEMTVKDGNNSAYHYSYDSFGRLIKEVNSLDDYQTYTYDKLGALAQARAFDGSKTLSTNPTINGIQTISYEDNSQNSYEYNMCGNIIMAQNEYSKNGYKYDKGAKLIEQKDYTTGETITFSYDRAGNLTRLVSSNKDTQYTYGKNKEVLGVYDRNLGLDIKLEYDCNGREICRHFSNGTYVQTCYDKAGRIILKIQKNRQAEIIWAQGYVYQKDGRLAATIDHNACVCFYEYDFQGRISSVYYPYNQEHEEKLKELAQTNGLDTSSSLATNRFLSTVEKGMFENLLNQMRYTLAYSLKTNQLLIKESFSYDKNGNLTTRTTALGSIEYSYDSENHLISSGSNGKTYVHYSYDKRGNLISEQGPAKKIEYEYNYQNRMIMCKAIDSSKNTISYSQYAYDAFGRRVLVEDFDKTALRTIYKGFTFDIIKESTVFANGLFTRFGYSGQFYDNSVTPNGDRYRYIEDKNNLDTNRYSYINDSPLKISASRYKGERSTISINNTLAAQITDSYGTGYLATDILGSVRAASNQYGTGTASCSFDIFGSPITGDYSSTAAVGLGYTGKLFDPTSSLYNYGYRDYNPSTSRFTSTDPIRDGFNWFAYCNGDPVNFVDINGLFSYKGNVQTSDPPQLCTVVYIYRLNDGLGNEFNSTRIIVKKDATGNERVYVDAVGANCSEGKFDNDTNTTTPDGKYYLTTNKNFPAKENGTFESTNYKNVLALATKDKNIPSSIRDVINILDRYFHPNQFKYSDSPYNSNQTPGSAGCIIGKDGQEHHDEMMEFLMEGVERPEAITVIIRSNSNQGGCSQ